MTITIGSFTTEAPYTVQPLAYEGEGRLGRTSRLFQISMLLNASDWANLVSTYDTWRDLRIQDPDSVESGTVGTTVTFSGPFNFSASAPYPPVDSGGLPITGPPAMFSDYECWFAEPPSGDQVGGYVNASVVLVDAVQALEVLLKEEEGTTDDPPDLGTVTVGTAVIKLLAPMETYEPPPAVQPTASGKDYIQGPLIAARRRRINGTGAAADWTGVQQWFEATVPTTPASGAWYPASAPTATAANKIESGVKVIEYTITLEQRQIV